MIYDEINVLDRDIDIVIRLSYHDWCRLKKSQSWVDFEKAVDRIQGAAHSGEGKKTVFPLLTLNFKDNVYTMQNSDQADPAPLKKCTGISVKKEAGKPAEIKLEMFGGTPDITGYLVSEKDTAITKCDCGEILGYGLKGCVVRCNYCGRTLNI